MGFRQPSSDWADLYRAIEAHAITRAPEGQKFTLASGKESSYYIDMRKVPLLNGLKAKQLTWEMTQMIPGDFKYVGAVPTGGLLLLPGVISSRSNQLTGFYVRKQSKGYGTGKAIEGFIGSDAPTVFVEDTVTTGGSLIDAIEVAREAGADVKLAIAAFDREEGAAEALAKIGVVLKSLFKASDFDL